MNSLVVHSGILALLVWGLCYRAVKPILININKINDRIFYSNDEDHEEDNNDLRYIT